MHRTFDFVAFTRVSATRPLYERDIMNAVCLPNGAHITLTYRKTWIADSTWQQLLRFGTGRTLLWGHWKRRHYRALIVLYDPDAQPNRQYLPLRFCTLQEVEIHEHLSSSFASTDQVEPGVTLCVSLRERPSERLINELRDVLAHAGAIKDGAPLQKYLADVEAAQEKFAPFNVLFASEANWQRHIAMLIARSSALSAERHWAIFGGIRPIQKGPTASGIPARLRDGLRVTTFPLRGGDIYEMDCHVHESAIGDFSESPISATVVGAHVEISPAGISQFGGGALVNLLIATQRKFAPESVGITFSFLVRDAAGTKMTPALRGKAPEFHCRFEISPSPYFWVITVLLLFGSAFLLNVSGENIEFIAGAVASQPSPQAHPETYAKLALYAKGLGGAFAALTGVFALRKMPVGK